MHSMAFRSRCQATFLVFDFGEEREYGNRNAKVVFAKQEWFLSKCIGTLSRYSPNEVVEDCF